MPAATNPNPGGVFDPSRGIDTPGSVSALGTITAYGVSGGIGYSSGGTGSTVTQATNRTTAVTINTPTGAITTNTASLAAEAAAAFTVNCSAVAITDVVVVSQRSGSNGGATDVYVSLTAAGSFTITVMNNNVASGTAETGAIIINYAVIKGATT